MVIVVGIGDLLRIFVNLLPSVCQSRLSPKHSTDSSMRPEQKEGCNVFSAKETSRRRTGQMWAGQPRRWRHSFQAQRPYQSRQCWPIWSFRELKRSSFWCRWFQRFGRCTSADCILNTVTIVNTKLYWRQSFTNFRAALICHAEIMYSDWLKQVTWLVASNQNACLKRSIATLL